MKRVLTLMLALILCLSCFAACTEIEQNPNETETKANEEEPLTTEQALKNAVAYVKDMYKQFLKTPETPIDFNLVSAVKVGGVDYTVTWTVDNEAIKVVSGEGEVTIDVPEKAEADIAYKLTATVVAADGTKSEPLVFELTVPAFKVNTIEEYYAAKKDDLVVFEGIVTGIVSTTKGATNKCIFLQDKGGKGGCYVYGMTDDPIADLGIEIGMTVRAAGAKDIYNGTHELNPTGIDIISKEKTDVTPIDLTEAFTAAADLKAESLIGVQGALVTIKGVEITGQDESSGYYKFKLGELETYVRISSSTCAISKDDQATFKATHTAKRGFKADVTGIVSIYNGAFYLVPVTVDAFSGFQEITRTDAEKVEYEAANITVVPEEIKLDGATVDLPLKGATYQDVVITWTSDKAWATIDETGKLTVRLQAAEETLKLTATVTLGENTKTVEFTVKVAKKPTVVPQVVDTPAANTAYKFFLTQENNGEILYLNGEMNGYYFATTTNHEEAVDVYLETVDGGYKFYFMKGDVKTYISIVRVESNGSMHNNVVFNAETPSVWTWNEENKTLTTVIDVDGTATTFYLGTYSTFSTISASKIDKAATSFVCHLATMVDIANCTHKYSGDCDTTCNICNAERTVTAEHTYTNACDAECDVCGATRTPADHVYDNACDKDCNVCGATRKTEHVDANGDKKCDVCDESLVIKLEIFSEPVADTAYMFYLVQVTAGKTLYLDGGVNGRYLTTTTDSSKAVDVYAEKVDSGYKFYILVENVKNYIEIYKNESNKISVKYDPNGVCVYTYDATTYSWQTKFDGVDYYLGTYNSFDTISASKTSNIDADKTRVSQFPLELITLTCTHDYSSDCDATCDYCGASRTVTAEHAYDNVCDATCNDCGATRTAPHDYADATCTAPKTCKVCGATDGEALGHEYVDGTCTRCGAEEIVGETTVKYDFATNFSTYAADWANSYSEKTLTSADLGTDLPSANIVLTNVSKQTSTITDCPVAAAKNNTVYVTFNLTESGKSISAITFNLKKWSDAKKFSSIILEYSSDGNTWTNCGSLTLASTGALENDTEAFSATTIADGNTYVRLVISTNESKNQQIGISSIEVTVK